MFQNFWDTLCMSNHGKVHLMDCLFPLSFSDFRGKRKTYEPPSNDNSEDGFDPEQGIA